MTEFEAKVLTELSALRCAVESLRSEFTISQVVYFENLPSSAIVDVSYVSYKFGCSKEAVVRGRFETGQIPRFRNKPLAFLKRDVDQIWLELNKPVQEKALEIRSKLNKRKKR